MAAKREAHLAMIQGAINRLAQNSFLLKGWSVLLVSALLVVAASSAVEADDGAVLATSPDFPELTTT